MKLLFYITPLLLILSSCSDETILSPSKKKRTAKGEYLYRLDDEHLYALNAPEPALPSPYPWEKDLVNNLPAITKEHFRCKGSSLHPERTVSSDGHMIKLYDCSGSDKHTLPLDNGKEFIYPALIELMNYIQKQTGKRVVVTCGHRCPDHNRYSDPSPENSTSKHMIGAEVAFYVQGMENRPQEIVNLLMQYYKEHPQFNKLPAYTSFERYKKEDSQIATEPWYNKEIFIKLYTANEGRDFDNRHPYPYIGVQVRHDRNTNERVIYSWDKAHRNFTRK